MTYLEIANEVLTLMRLDPITTTVGVQDEAVKTVLSHINAAKRKVENSWKWLALRAEWDLNLVQGTDTYALTDTYDQCQLDQVLHPKGWELSPMSVRDMNRQFATYASAANNPLYYTIKGTNAQREIEMKFWPPVSQPVTITVSGWATQPDLKSDDDELKVPHWPVVYEALAMSVRERGEVGGQTALEVFGMAKKYLEDAIALDAGISPYETQWYTI